jgi:pilus assembly protein CpaB
MRGRRNVIFLSLGLVLAVATGMLVFRLVRQAAPSAEGGATSVTPTPVPARPIPVAAGPLKAGQVLTTTDITERQYPENLLPVGVVTDTTKLVGQAVVEPIQPGEFFRPSQLRAGSALSQVIEPKNVAVAFATEDLLNKSKVIQEGDHIDLLLTMDVKEETPAGTLQGKATSFTLQNIRVLRIVRDVAGDQNASGQPQAILFEMKPQDAVIAKYVKDSGGTLDFTLRATKDEEPFQTAPINQDYILDNYGFKAPRSSAPPAPPAPPKP